MCSAHADPTNFLSEINLKEYKVDVARIMVNNIPPFIFKLLELGAIELHLNRRSFRREPCKDMDIPYKVNFLHLTRDDQDQN